MIGTAVDLSSWESYPVMSQESISHPVRLRIKNEFGIDDMAEFGRWPVKDFYEIGSGKTKKTSFHQQVWAYMQEHGLRFLDYPTQGTIHDFDLTYAMDLRLLRAGFFMLEDLESITEIEFNQIIRRRDFRIKILNAMQARGTPLFKSHSAGSDVSTVYKRQVRTKKGSDIVHFVDDIDAFHATTKRKLITDLGVDELSQLNQIPIMQFYQAGGKNQAFHQEVWSYMKAYGLTFQDYPTENTIHDLGFSGIIDVRLLEADLFMLQDLKDVTEEEFDRRIDNRSIRHTVKKVMRSNNIYFDDALQGREDALGQRDSAMIDDENRQRAMNQFKEDLGKAVRFAWDQAGAETGLKLLVQYPGERQSELIRFWDQAKIQEDFKSALGLSFAALYSQFITPKGFLSEHAKLFWRVAPKDSFIYLPSTSQDLKDILNPGGDIRDNHRFVQSSEAAVQMILDTLGVLEIELDKLSIQWNSSEYTLVLSNDEFIQRRQVLVWMDFSFNESEAEKMVGDGFGELTDLTKMFEHEFDRRVLRLYRARDIKHNVKAAMQEQGVFFIDPLESDSIRALGLNRSIERVIRGLEIDSITELQRMLNENRGRLEEASKKSGIIHLIRNIERVLQRREQALNERRKQDRDEGEDSAMNGGIDFHAEQSDAAMVATTTVLSKDHRYWQEKGLTLEQINTLIGQGYADLSSFARMTERQFDREININYVTRKVIKELMQNEEIEFMNPLESDSLYALGLDVATENFLIRKKIRTISGLIEILGEYGNRSYSKEKIIKIHIALGFRERALELKKIQQQLLANRETAIDAAMQSSLDEPSDEGYRLPLDADVSTAPAGEAVVLNHPREREFFLVNKYEKYLNRGPEEGFVFSDSTADYELVRRQLEYYRQSGGIPLTLYFRSYDSRSVIEANRAWNSASHRPPYAIIELLKGALDKHLLEENQIRYSEYQQELDLLEKIGVVRRSDIERIGLDWQSFSRFVFENNMGDRSDLLKPGVTIEDFALFRMTIEQRTQLESVLTEAQKWNSLQGIWSKYKDLLMIFGITEDQLNSDIEDLARRVFYYFYQTIFIGLGAKYFQEAYEEITLNDMQHLPLKELILKSEDGQYFRHRDLNLPIIFIIRQLIGMIKEEIRMQRELRNQIRVMLGRVKTQDNDDQEKEVERFNYDELLNLQIRYLVNPNYRILGNDENREKELDRFYLMRRKQIFVTLLSQELGLKPDEAKRIAENVKVIIDEHPVPEILQEDTDNAMGSKDQDPAMDSSSFEEALRQVVMPLWQQDDSEALKFAVVYPGEEGPMEVLFWDKEIIQAELLAENPLLQPLIYSFFQENGLLPDILKRVASQTVNPFDSSKASKNLKLIFSSDRVLTNQRIVRDGEHALRVILDTLAFLEMDLKNLRIEKESGQRRIVLSVDSAMLTNINNNNAKKLFLKIQGLTTQEMLNAREKIRKSLKQSGSLSQAIDELMSDDEPQGAMRFIEARESVIFDTLKKMHVRQKEFPFNMWRMRETDLWVIAKGEFSDIIHDSDQKLQIILTDVQNLQDALEDEGKDALRLPAYMVDIHMRNYAGLENPLPTILDLMRAFNYGIKDKSRFFLIGSNGLQEFNVHGASDTFEYYQFRDHIYESEKRMVENLGLESFSQMFHHNQQHRQVYQSELSLMQSQELIALAFHSWEDAQDAVFEVESWEIKELFQSSHASLLKVAFAILVNISSQLENQEKEDAIRVFTYTLNENFGYWILTGPMMRIFESREDRTQAERLFINSSLPIISAIASLHPIDQDEFNQFVPGRYSEYWESVNKKDLKEADQYRLRQLFTFYLDVGLEVIVRRYNKENVESIGKEIFQKYLERLTEAGMSRSGENDPLVKAAKELALRWGLDAGMLAKILKVQDLAMDTVGGIDFHAEHLDLSTEGQTMDIEFPALSIDPAQVQGVVPVILNVTPIPNIFPLLGLKPEDESLEMISRLSADIRYN